MGIVHEFSADLQIQSSTGKIADPIEDFLFLDPDIFLSVEPVFLVVDDVGGIDCIHTAKYKIN